MNKAIGILLSLLMITVLSACNMEQQITDSSVTSSSENCQEHQLITSFDAENKMRISIPKANLDNVYVRDASAEEKLDENTYGQVFLLADDQILDEGDIADHYLVIASNDGITVEDISTACYDGEIALCDFDGDGDKEILLQETVGASGGAGQYASRVLNFVEGELVEIFSYDAAQKNWNATGFSITILPDKEFLIENRFTDYSEAFRLEDRSEDYFREYWYDNNGNPKDLDLWVDSFYEFLPTDIDADGVYEIVCRQYAALTCHADGIGCAKTVLQYNKDTGAFDVIRSAFELNCD